MKPDVLVRWSNPPWQMEILQERYRLHRHDLATASDALLTEVGERIEAVVTNGSWGGLSSAALARLLNLHIAASSGVGYDPIDVEACTRRGVKVTNTPDVLTDDVADVAISPLIAARRGIVEVDRHVRSGAWASIGPMWLMGAIAGKRIGIAGFGRIGEAIARRAEAMRMETRYFGRRARPEIAYVFEPDLAALAVWADVLVHAMPGGRETAGIVGDRVIRGAAGRRQPRSALRRRPAPDAGQRKLPGASFSETGCRRRNREPLCGSARRQ